MPATTLRVRPVPGRTLPFEGAPKRFITTECEVPSTTYYRRAIRSGDLELAPEPKRRAKDADKETSK